MEPTLCALPIRLAMESVVSVWPKPSISLRPVRRSNWRNTSGFIASPAVVARLTEEKSYSERSCLIIMRYMVGGAQKVVMRYFANSGRMSAASKRSKS